MSKIGFIAGLPAAEYRRQWRLANKEKFKAYKEKYRAKPETKEKEKAYGAVYNRSLAHKQSSKNWYQKNADREKARVAQWRLDNRERMLVYKRQYLQANLDRHRLESGRRRARMYETRVGPIDLDKLLVDMTCGICSLEIEGAYDIDHILPLSRGGAHVQENLQLAHPLCNNRKGSKLMEELCV